MSAAEFTVEARPSPTNRDAYAVCILGGVVNRDGDLEYEPLPSSRDDAFIARCRFPRDTAVAIAERLESALGGRQLWNVAEWQREQIESLIRLATLEVLSDG